MSNKVSKKHAAEKKLLQEAKRDKKEHNKMRWRKIVGIVIVAIVVIGMTIPAFVYQLI